MVLNGVSPSNISYRTIPIPHKSLAGEDSF